LSFDNDEMLRRRSIEEDADESLIAECESCGPSRVAELTLGNGLVCTHMNNAVMHLASPARGESQPPV